MAPAAAHAPYDRDLQTPLEVLLECRFLTVWVDYPQHGSGMTFRDQLLNARVAGYMKRELSALGHSISEEPETAYWALVIMASNMAHRQFALTATLKLRNLKEGNASGFVRYPRPGELTVPTAYTALIHGSRRELQHRIREYVHQADTALLSTAQALCMYEAHEKDREREMEQQILDTAQEPVPTPQESQTSPPGDLGRIREGGIPSGRSARSNR
ncbi:MAG: hypothetical protein JSV80_08985 [Acidobacteriota bacterium]|nr:MAG: hypothetical protein JSV80_08985 [Acidobacteriota bacterium]